MLHNTNEKSGGGSVFEQNYEGSVRLRSWSMSFQKVESFGYIFVADTVGPASVSLTLLALQCA